MIFNMKKQLALLLLSPFVAGEELSYKDYQCGKGFKAFSVRHFDDGRLEYEDKVTITSGLKVETTDEILYWELSTVPGKKFRFKIDKINNTAHISGSGFRGQWRKWKDAGNCVL